MGPYVSFSSKDEFRTLVISHRDLSLRMAFSSSPLEIAVFMDFFLDRMRRGCLRRFFLLRRQPLLDWRPFEIPCLGNKIGGEFAFTLAFAFRLLKMKKPVNTLFGVKKASAGNSAQIKNRTAHFYGQPLGVRFRQPNFGNQAIQGICHGFAIANPLKVRNQIFGFFWQIHQRLPSAYS